MKLNARAVVRTSPQLAKSRPHQRETRYSLLHLHPQYIEGYWSTPALPARAPTQHHTATTTTAPRLENDGWTV